MITRQYPKATVSVCQTTQKIIVEYHSHFRCWSDRSKTRRYGLYSSAKLIGKGRSRWELWDHNAAFNALQPRTGLAWLGLIGSSKSLRNRNEWNCNDWIVAVERTCGARREIPYLVNEPSWSHGVTMCIFSLLFASPRMQGWYFVASASELAIFATVSRTLHPLLTILCYCLAAAVNVASVATSGFEACVLACKSSLQYPANVFFGRHTNSLSFGLEKAFQEAPLKELTRFLSLGWPAALFVFLRLNGWIILSVLVDLPQGLGPWNTLSRPMGWPVLQDEFIEPLQALTHALTHCLSDFWQGSTNGFEAFREFSFASTFRALVLGLALLTLPFRLIGLAAYLTSVLYHYTCDSSLEVEFDLAESMKQKTFAIEAWADEEEKKNNDKTCAELLFLNREMHKAGEYELCALVDELSDSVSNCSEISEGIMLRTQKECMYGLGMIWARGSLSFAFGVFSFGLELQKPWPSPAW